MLTKTNYMKLRKQKGKKKIHDKIIAIDFDNNELFDVYRDKMFLQICQIPLTDSQLLLAVTLLHDFPTYYDSILELEK